MVIADAYSTKSQKVRCRNSRILSYQF